LIIKPPKGPIRPIVEALMEMEIFEGFTVSLENSATYQLAQLQTKGGVVVEIDGESVYEVYHGIDGSTWSLEDVFSKWFPGMQRAAAFLVVWGWLENHMNELCVEVQKAGGYQIAVTDLTGEGLTRVRTYLLKVAGLTGDWSEKYWQELPDLQRVRNLLAHADGHLTAKHERHRAYAEASPVIEVENDSIYLKKDFLPHVLKRLNEFLHALHTAVIARFGQSA
jgi:hypothetical protein